MNFKIIDFKISPQATYFTDDYGESHLLYHKGTVQGILTLINKIGHSIEVAVDLLYCSKEEGLILFGDKEGEIILHKSLQIIEDHLKYKFLGEKVPHHQDNSLLQKVGQKNAIRDWRFKTSKSQEIRKRVLGVKEVPATSGLISDLAGRWHSPKRLEELEDGPVMGMYEWLDTLYKKSW